MASARSLRSTVEARSPCTASRPSVIAPAACSIALSSFSFASIGRPGSSTETVWNRSSNPWKLCSRVSCRSRAIRVLSPTAPPASSQTHDAIAGHATGTRPTAVLKRSPAESPKPVRLVVRRGDGEIQLGGSIVPDAVTIACDHAKGIFAGRQVRVERLPSRTGVVPIAVIAVEPVTKLYLLWNQKGGRSVINLQVTRMRWELEVVACLKFLSVDDQRFDVWSAQAALFARAWMGPPSLRQIPLQTRRARPESMPTS